MSTYYRIQQATRDTADLLDPERQWSASWHGDAEKPCPRCADDFDASDCDDCDGTGMVEDVRRGVSACDSLDDLYAYWQIAGGDLTDTVIVEMAGFRSTDDGHDAELGEVLVHPDVILSVTPVTDEIIDRILA